MAWILLSAELLVLACPGAQKNISLAPLFREKVQRKSMARPELDLFTPL
jgi:hypothetical protein